ncbi:hypothetical protein EVAR_81539_1 [Eumeta japonica]|uniref:Uncharacterized protein n=1 Tax=Eumeta variegata TaxID=151549 RepID=A0A4C1V138_EUMVA|nr:hypothetical protein EVAR_81539_1 [Eumeta japonica]
MQNKTKVFWDNVNMQYPVSKFPCTGHTSYEIGHQVRGQPETLRPEKAIAHYGDRSSCSRSEIILTPLETACRNTRHATSTPNFTALCRLIFAWSGCAKPRSALHIPYGGSAYRLRQYSCAEDGDEPFAKDSEKELLINYDRDCNLTSYINRSQTNVDFGFKPVTARVIPKPSGCNENLYLCPPSRKLESTRIKVNCHNTTEMKSNYGIPAIGPQLVTNKDQYKLPTNEELTPALFPYQLTPVLTSDEGHDKFLDPYLTVSRLHHRPFTDEQLGRPSNRKDIVTYYTFADLPWVRTPKPSAGEWWLSRSWPKSVYDREKFKQGFRETIVHNISAWVPGSFRTEVRDNYSSPASRPTCQAQWDEADVKHELNGAIKSSTIEMSGEGI